MTNRIFCSWSALILVTASGCSDKATGPRAADASSEPVATTASSQTAEPVETNDETPSSAHDAKPAVFEDCATAKGGDAETTSKTAEAKNTIGAIARAAVTAYEREQLDDVSHRLCASANPVPAQGPPKAATYQPNTAAGEDFGSGDAQAGWRCLKFAMSTPHHYQYGYNVGSGYKSTAFGLPDPGPDGYEVWAMGDLDGDGRPSLYVSTGKITETTKLVRNRTIACVDPFE